MRVVGFETVSVIGNCIPTDDLNVVFDTPISDSLGDGAVLERVEGLLIETLVSGHAGYHNGFRVAAQRLLENAGELGVAEGHIGALPLC
jgi:hypothetical protein